MSMPDNRFKYKRANLFLLRVWCEDDDENEHSDKGEKPCRIWHGKVQRTVSGEVQSFETKDRLIEVLEAMIYKDRKERPEQSRPPRPRGKASSETGLPASGNNGNNQTEANEGSEVTKGTRQTRQVSNKENHHVR